MDLQEITRMNRILQVEDLSFRIQLEEAVRNTTSIIHIHFLPFSLSVLSSTKLPSQSFQGFSDTSLTVGEVATILQNYECHTGKVLNWEDLQEKKLASLLIPEDYDIKNKVI